MSFESPQSRSEAILQNILGADNELEPPQSRVEELLQQILETGGGGGEGVTPAAIVTATGNMTDSQKTNTRTNIGAAQEPIAQTVSGSTPTITAADNTIYKCGEVTSLTVTAAANIAFTVIFTSGATPATLTMDENIVMPDGFSVEANTRYEINVVDGYAVAAGWAVSSGA